MQKRETDIHKSVLNVNSTLISAKSQPRRRFTTSNFLRVAFIKKGTLNLWHDIKIRQYIGCRILKMKINGKHLFWGPSGRRSHALSKSLLFRRAADRGQSQTKEAGILEGSNLAASPERSVGRRRKGNLKTILCFWSRVCQRKLLARKVD